MTAMKNYNIAECSDTGQVRQVNEDSMAWFESPNGTVLVVCDGMGGQNAGDVASQLAVAVIRDILTDNTFSSPEEAITRSITAANQAILNRAAQNDNLSGMGSTCVMLIINGGKVYYGSVGDSRIYYMTPSGDIRQLTRDQSYVQALVDAGEITAADAEHHQDKNQITNALGIETMMPPVVSPAPVVPEPGSIFLLCSDGLSNMVSASEIAGFLRLGDVTVQQKAEALVAAANSAGGADNITVQLVEFPQGAGGAVDAGDAGTAMKKEIKKNRTIAYMLAVLTVLILGAGAAFFFFPDDKSSREEKKQQQTTSQQKPPKPTQQSLQPQPSPQQPQQPEVIYKEKVIVVDQTTAKQTKSTGKPEPIQKGKTAKENRLEKKMDEVQTQNSSTEPAKQALRTVSSSTASEKD